MTDIVFLGLGDVHGQVKWTDGLAAAARQANAVLVCGDITTFGTIEDAASVLDDIGGYCDTIYAIAGNCDSVEIDSYLLSRGLSLNGFGVLFNTNIGLCGVSGSNRTPFRTPNEFRDEELSATLIRGWSSIEAATTRIIVHHVPPHKTRCDRMRLGPHVGLRSLRLFCEKKQPELLLCGHVHEARGSDAIGSTIIVNGGMASKGEGVLITVSGDDIRVELI